MASPLSILLFGGSLAVAHDSSYVQVDGWLRIRCGGARLGRRLGRGGACWGWEQGMPERHGWRAALATRALGSAVT